MTERIIRCVLSYCADNYLKVNSNERFHDVVCHEKYKSMFSVKWLQKEEKFC